MSGTPAAGRIRARLRADADLVVGAALVIGCVVAYGLTIDTRSETTFPALARAVLDGQLSVPFEESRELIPVGDRGYVPLPPTPALVHLPFAAIGLDVGPQPLAVVMSALSVLLAHRLLRAMGTAQLPATLIAVGFAGSTLWSVTASAGRMWQFAHVVGVLFAVAALFLAWRGRVPLAAGVLLGVAAGARLPIGLMLPVLLYLYRGQGWRAWVPVLAGLAVVAVPIGYYNLARFGSPLEFGHALIPSGFCPGTVACEPWYQDGILSLSYIPRSIGAALFTGFHISNEPPWLLAPYTSLSLAITAPIYFLALGAGRSRLALVLGASVLLVMLPNLAHGAWGFIQYGYRFILDAAPLLVMLLGLAYRQRATPALWVAAVGGCLATIYGLLLFRVWHLSP